MNNDILKAKKHIEELLDEFLQDFSVEHKHKKNLTSDFHADEARMIGYKGREMLELLQNVDDEYERLCQANPDKKGLEVSCLIEYKDNVLRVCNTGTVFDEDGINSICQAATSNKGEKYIGQKGIGFRAILNWAKEVHIFSGNYSVEFSEEFADEKLKEIAIKSESVRKQIERERKNKNRELRIPMLNAPRWIEPKEFNYSEKYDTIIEILVKPETQNDDWSIEKQIKKFDENILLFLPNLTKINFVINDKKYTFTKKTNGSKEKITKLIIESPERNEETEYYVYAPEDDILIEKRHLKLSIAIPKDESVACDKPLYTFFPIGETETPFNALIHATFELDENRETISDLEINQEIFKELLKFYVLTVTKNFNKPKFKNRVLKLLCPKNYNKYFSFEKPFYSNEIFQYYLNLCRKHSIFLTVNGKFISNEDKPKVLQTTFISDTDRKFPQYFECELFNDLLIPIDNSLEPFFNAITPYTTFDPQELYERINVLSERLNPMQRVETFFWWTKNETDSNLLPRLIQENSNNHNWLEFGDTCFYSGKVTNIPDWANLKFIDTNYEKSLKMYCLWHNIDLSQYPYYKFIDFEEYTIENIISPINDKIENNYDRAIEFVQFLVQNFDLIKNCDSIKDSSLHFPDSEGGVSDSSTLYLGKDYGNSFSEEILKLAGYKKVCSPESLGFDKNKKTNLKDFFSFFGVVSFPRIKPDVEVYSIFSWNEKNERIYKSNGDWDYSSYIKTTLNYFEIHGIKTQSINNIKEIIQSLNTKDLLSWIFVDKQLNLEITNDFVSSHMMYRENPWDKTTKGDNYRNIEIPCYLKYVFSTEKWVEINGEKYAPSECIFSMDSRLSKYYKQCISNDWLKQNCGNFTPKELKDLLVNLGMKAKITELDSEHFYSLLLELQNDDNSFEISKYIYSNIVSDGIKKFDYSTAQYNFETKGKVWTKNKNGYQPVSEVFFSSSAVVNVHNKYLIDLPLRTGSENVMKNIFFIEPYQEEYTVDSNSIHISPLDSEFQELFYKYLPYVFCYRIETANATEQKKFKNLKVQIVDSIKIKDNDGIEEVSRPYTLLCDSGNSNQWYIYINDNFLNLNEISELVKQIFEVILNTENINRLDRFCELFVANDSRRDFLIEKDLGRISILKESIDFLYGIVSEKELILKYLQEQNQLSDKAKSILEEISFSNLNSVSQQEKLFNFLNLTDLDVIDIQKILDRYDISIEQYNFNRIEKYFSKMFNNFYQVLYESLKRKSLDEKKLFLQKISKYWDYHNLDGFKNINSIKFNVEDIYENALVEIIGEKEVHFEKYVDIKNIFSENLKLLKEKYGETICDVIPQDIESLLYFDFDDMKKEFLIWQESHVNKNIQKEKSFLESDKIHFDEVKPVKRTSNPKARSKTNSVRTPTVWIDAEKDKQEQGDAAERIIYNLLFTDSTEQHEQIEEALEIKLSDYNINQISKGLGRVLNQTGFDGLGCDIELSHKETGTKFFIEIKSSKGSECRFDISKKEFETAESHPDSYRVIFVGDMAKKEHSIQILPKEFWKSENYKMTAKEFEFQYIGKY